jgi:hypothetical protein
MDAIATPDLVKAADSDKSPGLRKLAVAAILLATVTLAVIWHAQASAHSGAATGGHATCAVVDPVHPKLVPVPGFDPNTASDAQLQAQDFPPRPDPSDARAVAAWNHYVSLYLAGNVIQCANPGPDYVTPPEYQQLMQSR